MRRRWLPWTTVSVVICAALFVAIALATDRSEFCASCHEMTPYHDAWVVGAHGGEAECIDCHVEPGLPSRFAHKFVALGEVYAHFTGDTSFPRPVPASVPDDRCARCHDDVSVKGLPAAFDHDTHAGYEACQVCHERAGHDVTSRSLQAAGIYNAKNAASRARARIASGAVAAPDVGAANLAGHKRVPCSRCHDMKATGCPSCHALPEDDHPKDSECVKCHRPGERFVFSHPSTSDCATCHKAPAEDHPAIKTCPTCHKASGKSWSFSHPVRRECAECHRAPKAPHPTSTSCRTCHTQPGRSWAFRHTGNTGEHSYRSFPCAKCHPSGFGSATCTCHEQGVEMD